MRIHKIAILALSAPVAVMALTGCGDDDEKSSGGEGEGEGEGGEGEGEGGEGEGEGEEGEGEGEGGEGEGEGEGGEGEGEGEGEENPCVPGDLAATLANNPKVLNSDNGEGVAAWIDRAGRPAINTALIKLVHGDEMADAYNQSPFENWGNWADEFDYALWTYGCLDGVQGGLLAAHPVAGGAGVLAGFMATDVLTIDTSKGYAQNGYLGYEDAALSLGVYVDADGNPVDKSGGGRTLSEEVVGLTVTAVTGAAGVYPAVAQDGEFPVDDNGAPAWPYLAPAN